MGGFGSGRYQSYEAKETVEEVTQATPALTIGLFVKNGLKWNRTGSGTLRWHSGKIDFIVSKNVLHLMYAHQDKTVSLRVHIVETVPNYGGLRLWFKCPGCSRRCSHLYRPAGRVAYACRVCSGLVYQSTRSYRYPSQFRECLNLVEVREKLQRMDEAREKRIQKMLQQERNLT